MQTLEHIRGAIAGMEDLQAVVRTMKTLAAVSIRQYERAAGALNDYFRTIELGLYVVLKEGLYEAAAQAGQPKEGLVAVVMGSDQGLCGRFNDQIAAYALETMAQLEPRRERRAVICVGARAHVHLEEAGQPVTALFSVPESLQGVTAAVQDLLAKLEELHGQGRVERVTLFFNVPQSGASYRPLARHLLPLDQAWLHALTRRNWPNRVLPVFTMDQERLFASLVREYLFMSIYRALVESLAGENASRLASMQVAERNIGERLDELHAVYRHRRQSAITEELLDIVAGREASTQGTPKYSSAGKRSAFDSAFL